MPKNKHKGASDNPTSGFGFIKLARQRGAQVSHNGSTGFTKVKTPSGSVQINPSDDRLDNQTISNLKRWFKLLGLMSLILWGVDLLWGWLQLPPLF